MEPSKVYKYKKHVIGYFPELTNSAGKKGLYKVCHEASDFDQTYKVFGSIVSAKQDINELIASY